jgi:insecticidal toxin complex protein TccC
MVRNNPVGFFDADGLGRRSIRGNKQEPLAANIQNIKSTITYHDPNLNTRFDSLPEASKTRFAYVEKNLTHQILLQHTINSTSAKSNFNNKFEPHHWQFRYNFRNPEVSDYFANDVARYQYSKISRDEGFFGQLPSKITRYNVINKETLKQTKYLKNGTERMLYTFMRDTPNGKSTQRILEDFGLRAIKVERLTSEGKVHFLIHVKPIKTQPSKENALSFERSVANNSVFDLSNNFLAPTHRRTGLFSSLRNFLLCHQQYRSH